MAGNNHCPKSQSAVRSKWYAVENTEPHHAWERYYLLEFAIECLTGMDDFLHIAGQGETIQSPSVSHCPAIS